MPISIKKAFRDIKKHKVKIGLMIGSLTICLTVMATLLNTMDSFKVSNTFNEKKTNKSDVIFHTAAFKAEKLSTFQKIKDVKTVDARLLIKGRVSGKEKFNNFELITFPETGQYRLNKFNKPVKPQQKGIYFEGTTMRYFNMQPGEQVEIIIPSSKEALSFTVNGVVEDSYQIPADFSGVGTAYLPQEAFQKLGIPPSFNKVHVSFHSLSQSAIDHAKLRLEEDGINVYKVERVDGNTLVRETMVNAIFSVLLPLAAVASVLGIFLTSHIFQRMIAEQTKEMTIQKIVGATTGYLWRQFAVTVLIIGLSVFSFSVILSGTASYYVTSFLIQSLNMGIPQFVFQKQMILLILFLSLVMPCLASVMPISKIINQPVLYGLSKGRRGTFSKRKTIFRSGFFHSTIMAIRETLSKKTQLLTTVLVLSFGSSIILSSIALERSLMASMNDIKQFSNYDIEWQIRSNQTAEKLVADTKAQEEVKTAEAWIGRNVQIGTKEEQALLLAMPGDTTSINPTVLKGSWLSAENNNGIVVSSDLQSMLGNVQIGDMLPLTIGEESKEWKISGIILGQLNTPTIYMNEHHFKEWITDVTPNRLMVTLNESSRNQLDTFMRKTEKSFKTAQIGVDAAVTTNESNKRIEDIIHLVTTIILIAGSMFTALGLANLITMLALNVLERMEEIGILKCLGASNFKVFQLFFVECLYILLITSLFAVGWAIPIYMLLSRRLGQALLQSELHHVIPVNISLIWLLLTVLIGVFATLLTVWKTVRKPVIKLI